MSRAIVIAFSTLLLAALAACAGDRGPWEKPGVDEEQKAKDMYSCRDYVHERVNSRAVRQTESAHSRAVAAQELDRNDDMSGLRRMDEAEHLKLERNIFEQCMRANGYSRANDN